MQRILLLAAIVLLSGLLAWMLFFWKTVEPPAAGGQTSTSIEAPRGGDFTLTSYRGPVNLADYRGRVVMLYFGYTWCPDICPTNLAIFSRVLNALTPSELAQVQALFVSVDPRRDTPARLREYATYFHERLIGITGTEREVAKVAALYGVAYRAVNSDNDANYAVDHSANTYLIDRRGRLVEILPHGTQAPALLQAVRSLLASPG